MIKYKLTDQQMRTHNGFQWELGKPVETSGEGDLCGPGWLHYYDDPILAVLLNPIHANIANPRLFECSATGKHKLDRGLKGGCTQMTLNKELDLPTLTRLNQVAFGILCALEVYRDPAFVEWANAWISGNDRTKESADAAAAYAAAYAASASYAAYAANAAAYAKRKLDLITLAHKAMEIT